MDIPREIVREEQIAGFRVLYRKKLQSGEECNQKEITLVRRLLELIGTIPPKPEGG